jgi:hypothetical protein
MRRQLILLTIAITALVGIAAVASAQEPNGEEFHHSFIIFLGDCEGFGGGGGGGIAEASVGSLNGCFGFGVFFGLWDEESMPLEIQYEAEEELGGFWRVGHLKAFNLAHRGNPIIGGMNGGGSGYECPAQTGVEAAQSIPAGELWGVWIAFFTVEPCDIYEE